MSWCQCENNLNEKQIEYVNDKFELLIPLLTIKNINNLT
jgi:hypothetical protein